jgi:hypothetical protein
MSESLRVKSRTPKKEVVEDCLRLDAVFLRREGLLKPGVRHCGQWQWHMDPGPKEPIAVVGYEANTLGDPAWLRLSYTLAATGEQVDYRVLLATTRPHYGGLCWWLVCPLVASGVACGRQVGKLYLPRGASHFGCRRCHDLTYTSCQESHRDDALHRRMACELGRDPAALRRALAAITRRGGR